MNQVLPQVTSTIQVVDARSGIVVPREVRYGGQSGHVKLDGKVVNPGPWMIEVKVDVVPSEQEGGVIALDIGYFTKADLTNGVLAGVAAPTGVFAPHGSTGSDFVPGNEFYTPLNLGGVPSEREGVGSAAFWFGQAMIFNNGWIGPNGAAWWTELPARDAPGAWGPGGAAFPAGADTNNVEPAPYPQSSDPEADFDFPVVGVFYRAYGCVVSHGDYPPPFIASNPSFAVGGTVRLYNAISSFLYPLAPFRRVDFEEATSVAIGVGFDPALGQVVPQDATCATSLAQYAYADLSQPPDAPTRAADTAQAASGLIAVG